MATVEKAIRVCDKCESAEGVVSRSIVVDGQQFVVELCGSHNAAFDRDTGKWASIGVEIERPKGMFTTEVVSSMRRAAMQRDRELQRRAEHDRGDAEVQRHAKQAESDARRTVPGSARWDLTSHAKARMTERGFSFVDVFLAVVQPEMRVEQPWKGKGRAVYVRGECRVVVSQIDGVIITVIDRAQQLQPDPRMATV